MENRPSISFLITTIGRKTLFKTLDSLNGALESQDQVNVIFDGKSEIDLKEFEKYKIMAPCEYNLIMHPENLGYWGHGLRNYYQGNLKGDYIHHIDDDDIYVSFSFPKAREYLIDNFGKLLLFKFWQNKNTSLWQTKKVMFGNLGTPSGMFPNVPDKFGKWGYFYGGDFSFYEETCKNFEVEFIDFNLVQVRPHVYGFK